MSVQLSALRAKVYAHLQEEDPTTNPSSPNTHFPTTGVIDGFLNEGVEFAAVFIEYQRTLTSLTPVAGTASYANPANNLIVRTAYFGDRTNITNDIRPLKIVSEETLKEMFPTWLDQTSATRGDRPSHLIQLDRNNILIFPTPNSVAAASGKKIWLNYNYVPTAMSADSDVPDLPLPYHNLVPLYALHLCYIALKNVALSEEMYKVFMEKVNRIKSAVTEETKENFGFSWGYTDVDVSTSGSDVIIP